MGMVSKIINVGYDVWSTSADYKRYKKESKNKGIAIAKTAGSFVFNAITPLGPSLAYTAATTLPQVMSSLGEMNAKVGETAYKQRGKLGSGYFDMSQAGYTMRQRSLNAIRSNGLNMQSTLGNEARQYFR